MYEGVKTWNPFVGCEHDCVYCRPSFQRQAKRRKKWCKLCYNFEPHFHPERLNKIPKAKTIFACAYGDIAFAKIEWVGEIVKAIEEHPEKTFYIQTKRPRILADIKELFGIPENVKLGITVETDSELFATPSEYKRYWQISCAPNPSKRLSDTFFIITRGCEIDYVTIEPILDFSWDFVRRLKLLNPEFVYIGYDNHNCKLPEPPLEKTLKLIEELEKFTEVRLKTIRRAWWEADAR
jgi:DNA repair photolyase